MPSKIKTNPETPLVFQKSTDAFPTGIGFPSGVIVDFRADSLPPGSGALSIQFDLGPGPRTTLFLFRMKAVTDVSATIGLSVDAFIANSISVIEDGTLSNQNKCRNLQWCGAAQCDYPGDPAISTGLVEIFSRYISLVWWNNTDQNLGSTGNYFVLTPMPDEIQ
jgi:hypothetical protein